LSLLGTEHAWVVHGADGLDEITLADKTFVAEARDGLVSTFETSPEDFGLRRNAIDYLRGGDVQGNSKIIREVLGGERRDAARGLIVLNAAAALFVGGLANTLQKAAALAETSIDSGAAMSKLKQLVAMTNE
jgi:anthranilate phosphoribosyltransferase